MKKYIAGASRHDTRFMSVLLGQIQSILPTMSVFDRARFVAVIGNTKAGKSTGIHGLMGHRLTWHPGAESDDSPAIPWMHVLDKPEEGPVIGQDPRACTLIPGLYPSKTGVMLGDFPGFMGNRDVMLNIVEGVSRQQALAAAESIDGVLLFVSYLAFETQGGRLVVDALRNLMELLKDPFSVESSIVIVVTQSPRHLNESQVKRRVLSHINAHIRSLKEADGVDTDQLALWRLMGRALTDRLFAFEADRPEDVSRVLDRISHLKPIENAAFRVTLATDERLMLEHLLGESAESWLSLRNRLAMNRQKKESICAELKTQQSVYSKMQDQISKLDRHINTLQSEKKLIETQLSKASLDIQSAMGEKMKAIAHLESERDRVLAEKRAVIKRSKEAVATASRKIPANSGSELSALITTLGAPLRAVDSQMKDLKDTERAFAQQIATTLKGFDDKLAHLLKDSVSLRAQLHEMDLAVSREFIRLLAAQFELAENAAAIGVLEARIVSVEKVSVHISKELCAKSDIWELVVRLSSLLFDSGRTCSLPKSRDFIVSFNQQFEGALHV